MHVGDLSDWHLLSSVGHTATSQCSRTAQTRLSVWGMGHRHHPWAPKQAGTLPTSSHHHLHQNIFWRCLVLGKGSYNLPPIRADIWIYFWLLCAIGSPYIRKVCEQQFDFWKDQTQFDNAYPQLSSNWSCQTPLSSVYSHLWRIKGTLKTCIHDSCLIVSCTSSVQL